MKLLSLAYWALICVTAPFFFLGAVVIFAVTALVDRRRIVLHLYSCAWASFFVAVNPLWRLRITGRDWLPWRGPAVLVANHASLVDILVLFGLFRPYKWVSKRENFKIPFIGWNMTLNGYVPLVRGDRASVVTMLDRCRVLLAQGSPILMFPEGTRTRDGHLQPFKDGAFELAHELGLPVIPIAVHATRRALPKHGIVLRNHIDAHVEVLAPLDPAAFAGPAELREAAHERIGDALGEPGRRSSSGCRLRLWRPKRRPKRSATAADRSAKRRERERYGATTGRTSPPADPMSSHQPDLEPAGSAGRIARPAHEAEDLRHVGGGLRVGV